MGACIEQASAQRMQQEYVDFMTTPGSHNDAYASSYHRMFPRARVSQKGAFLSRYAGNDIARAFLSEFLWKRLRAG